MSQIGMLILAAGIMFTVLGAITLLAHIYNLNNIKAKTVGDGQHGTARWARRDEIVKTYKQIPFTPEQWRKGENLPKDQGIIVGCDFPIKSLIQLPKQKIITTPTALVDTGDVHCMMIGAAGVGKTAFWLYPNLEFACASGMSFLSTDTKGVRPDRVQ